MRLEYHSSNTGVTATKKELQEIARIRGVDLFHDKEIIKPGVAGTAKRTVASPVGKRID